MICTMSEFDCRWSICNVTGTHGKSDTKHEVPTETGAKNRATDRPDYNTPDDLWYRPTRSSEHDLCREATGPRRTKPAHGLHAKLNLVSDVPVAVFGSGSAIPNLFTTTPRSVGTLGASIDARCTYRTCLTTNRSSAVLSLDVAFTPSARSQDSRCSAAHFRLAHSRSSRL